LAARRTAAILVISTPRRSGSPARGAPGQRQTAPWRNRG